MKCRHSDANFKVYRLTQSNYAHSTHMSVSPYYCAGRALHLANFPMAAHRFGRTQICHLRIL